MLKNISDQIYLAIKQAELYKTVKETALRESLLREITQTIRSSLDIFEIMENLVTEVGKVFNADRCFIRLFDYKGFSNNAVYKEYLASSDVKSTLNYNYTKEFDKFVSDILSNNNMTVHPDTELLANNPDVVEDYKKYIKDMDVKSNYGIPIFVNDKFIGVIVIHYTKEKKELFDSDIKLLQMVANQAGIAINQAELYKTVQETAKREKLIRETILSFLSSVSAFNIKEVFKAIVTEIGKLFEADRCFFVEYDPDNNTMFSQEECKEYISDKTIMPAYSRENTKEELAELVKMGIHQKQIAKVENVDEVKLPEATKILLNELSLKSFIGLPIFFGETPLGMLVLHYVKKHKQFSQQEIDTLNTIATQSGIIINQAKLYEQLHETAEKEKILAEIMSVIKSNLKIDEIFLIICGILRKFYSISRIIISRLDTKENELNILKECYKNNLAALECKLSPKSKQYLYEKILKNKNLIINNIETANNPKYFLKDIALMNVKSFIMIPIKINPNETGAFIIHDDKINNWQQEDISFLSRITDYISIAIKESNMYNQSEFISNVSHELKTPLAIVNGYADALLNLENPNCKTANNFLQIIKNNSDRLNKLIDNLLFISTIEKKVEYKNIVFEELKITDLIENSIQLCDEKLKSKKIKIEKNLENIVIKKANIILLQQLIVNLITNAINYSNLKSTIKINAERKNREILINVEDSGYGIKEEHLQNIFERFYRVDKSRSRETGGTGLGLSISKLISEIHGGHITVKSVFEKGSIFTLHLPE